MNFSYDITTEDLRVDEILDNMKALMVGGIFRNANSLHDQCFQELSDILKNRCLNSPKPVMKANISDGNDDDDDEKTFETDNEDVEDLEGFSELFSNDTKDTKKENLGTGLEL